MEFFKKRSTAWAVFALVVVCTFFIGRAKKPSDEVLVLPERTYIQDNANVLSSQTEEYITKINNGLVSAVGAEVSIATVDTTGGKDIYEMATKLGMDMNLSSNSCVFLIAVNDTNAVIIQGEKIMYEFSDDELSKLLNSYFTEKDFETRKVDGPILDVFNGLISMYEDYYSVKITGSANITVQPQSSQSASDIAMGIVGIVLIVIFILLITRPRRPRPIIPVMPMGGYRRPRTGYYPPRGSYNTPPAGGTKPGSSRTGGFGSSSRGGGFGGSSRGGGFKK